MLIDYKRGQTSIVLRVKILDSTVTTGAGKTGLSSATSGLIISTIADNEATATAYTVAGSTIESITTLGTYATPTATKCRFKEVDSTGHKGIYEIQLADARFAVSSAKSLLVSISGATGAAETDAVVPLRDVDLYDSVRGGMTALPNAAADAAGGLPISDAGGLDLDTVGSNVAAILVDTAEIGAAGAGLTNINLPNQTMDIVGNITGNLSGSVGSVTGAVGSVTGAVGSVTGNVGGNVAGSVNSVVSTVPANVKQVNDVTLTGDGDATPWGPA